MPSLVQTNDPYWFESQTRHLLGSEKAVPGWRVDVIGNVAAVATVPSTARLRTTPVASAKKTLPAATCADGGRTAPIQERAGDGMGANVALARSRPSRPAIATVLYVHALAVPLASSTANSSGEGEVCEVGLGDPTAELGFPCA